MTPPTTAELHELREIAERAQASPERHAAYIAAFNPVTTLRLIDALEAAEAANERLREGLAASWALVSAFPQSNRDEVTKLLRDSLDLLPAPPEQTDVPMPDVPQ